MMIERRERELKKLYDSTEKISEPKITPVLGGVHRIEGSIDESDFELRKPDLILPEEKQSLESRISKFEKGTCNVCSTPCLSCSHLKDQHRLTIESKSEPDKVIKEEEFCPSISQVGDNNTQGCALACDPKAESIEGKMGADGKNVKGEGLSRSAKSSLVSDEVEEKMVPDTILADGNESDKMTGIQEDDVKKVDMTDNKSENGKNPTSSGDGKEKTSEAENSDEVEDDVKVCDICGDTGQEDLLAFCTRCSDGAEHTYCMRVMMDKLPEGEWLCEECQIEVHAEKQKEKQKAVAKSDERREKKTEAKVLEKKPPRRLNSYFQRKEENQEEPKKLESTCEKKMESKVVPKKTVSNVESTDPKKSESVDVKKKQPAEAKRTETTDTKKPEPTDTKKIDTVDTNKNLSLPTRENPILDSELDKGKLGSSLSRGALSKSSFKAPSSKVPKVKQITEVPQNPKLSRDSVSSNNLRKEPDCIISKSSSFKNPNQSATTETLKKPPPKEPKDRNLMNNTSNVNNNNSKGTSILGRPSVGILSAPKIDSGGAAISQGPDNGLTIGRNEIKKPGVPKPSGSLLPRPDDISTCSLLDSILQKNVPSAAPKALRCQRCNEIGHAIQSCPKDPTRLSALKPPPERNSKEGVLKRPKFMDQKELENPTIRMDLSNGLKIDPARPCSLVPVVSDWLKSNTIPEVDFIWQGCFELVREGRPPDRYDGFQAHFSSCVSPRVPELVRRFPLQVQLEEVPRQKTWPVQFEKGGPTEDNIAIYFFARDHESYENCYMKLVETMRKNDVALKGKIGTADLLVFPSSLLPEYSQRWNKLYYLWGIFKGNGANISKEGLVSTSFQDLNHCENMEVDSNSKTITDSYSKDKPDVKAGTVQEKEAEHVSTSPPLVVDLNSCEDIEPEPQLEPDKVLKLNKQKDMVHHTDFKKAAQSIGSESCADPQKEKLCEKPTSLAFKCHVSSPAEEISRVHSTCAESSRKTTLEFQSSSPSSYPSTAQGDGISIDLRASRKRSMESFSSFKHAGIGTERDHKKTKVDNGDLNFVFNSNHAKPMEEILDERDDREKEVLPPQSVKNVDVLFPALINQSRGKFSRITSADETMVRPIINLESPPRETSTPDLELALGDTKKSPKKGPMLPFLSPPKVNIQGDSSNTRPILVKDETASLSLSLGFPNALSGLTGQARPNEFSGNRDLFPFSRPRDS